MYVIWCVAYEESTIGMNDRQNVIQDVQCVRLLGTIGD